MRNQTRERFPHDISASDRVSIGGIFFLRFLCPTLVLPLGVDGLLSDTNRARVQEMPSVKRNLLLIVKVLQQLSNGSSFSDENLQPLNEWLSFHSSALSGFFSKISTTTVDTDILDCTDMNDTILEQFKVDSRSELNTSWLDGTISDSFHEMYRDCSLPESSAIKGMIHLHGLIIQKQEKISNSTLSNDARDMLRSIMFQLQEVPIMRTPSPVAKNLDTKLFLYEKDVPERFILGIEKHPSLNTTLEYIRSSMAIYSVNFRPSLWIPSALYVILRRVNILHTADDVDSIMYSLIQEFLLVTSRPGSFDVVIDCSLYNRNCFPNGKGDQLWQLLFKIISRSTLISRSEN